MDHLLLHRAPHLFTVDALFFPSSPSSIIRFTSFNPPPSSSTFHSYCSFLGFSPKPSIPSGVCYCSPGSQLPESDPPQGKHSITEPDLEATFSKVQDRTQIFFAVLFWMSLFFWNCAWDGKNDDDPTSKTRFRK